MSKSIQRPTCPKCGSTNVWKNGHDEYHNQLFLCKDCRHSFKLTHSKKRKNFSFPYPKCPHCGKAMEIHKIRRGFVVFRCRSCRFKDRIPLNLPYPLSLPLEPFKYFRFPIYIVLKAFVLYFKFNMSYRALKNSLNIDVSHVTIYKWIVRLSFFFSIFIPENVFKVHGDETVVVFKNRKYYVWFLVDHDTNLILSWHVSRYRDMSQVRILLNKFFSCYSNDCAVEFITDGLGAYDAAVNLLFKNIDHTVVSLGGNNQCESKFSLFKDFIRLKRRFKKFSNFLCYVHGFCVVKNLFKLHGGDVNCVISSLASIITTS